MTTNHWVAEASHSSRRGAAGDAGGERVEAGVEAGDDVAHRQGRGDVAVELLGELARALPDRLAEGVAQAGLLGAGQRAAEVAVAEHRRRRCGCRRGRAASAASAALTETIGTAAPALFGRT